MKAPDNYVALLRRAREQVEGPRQSVEAFEHASQIADQVWLQVEQALREKQQ